MARHYEARLLDQEWHAVTAKDKNGPEFLGGQPGRKQQGQGHDIQTSPTCASQDSEVIAAEHRASLAVSGQEKRENPGNGPVVDPATPLRPGPNGTGKMGRPGPQSPAVGRRPRLTRKGRKQEIKLALTAAVAAEDRQKAEARTCRKSQERQLINAYRASRSTDT